MNFKLNIQLFGNAVIPYNEGRNGKRSIDGLWEQEFNVAKALTAAIGCEFGSVLNIQDAGQKEQGKVYLDKNNGKLYKCLNTTTSVSNTTENFALFNVQQNSDRLDNLFSNITTSWFELPIEQISGEVTENIWTFDKKAKVILNYTYTQLSSDTGFDYLTILINDKKVAMTPSVNAISHEYLPINISGIAIFNCEVNDVLSIQSHNNVVKYFKSNTWSMTYF